MTLPFIDTPSRWPTMKEPEERVVNPSYDKQIQDQLVNEIFEAMEHKEPIHKSLMSLIQSIKQEERGND